MNTKPQKVDFHSLVQDLFIETTAPDGGSYQSQRGKTVPSAADMLAYFSGKLSPEKKETVERQIVDNPESLEILRIFTKICEEDLTPVPAETINQTTDTIIDLIKRDELRHRKTRLKR